jgi:hypothetical protein
MELRQSKPLISMVMVVTKVSARLYQRSSLRKVNLESDLSRS